VREADLAGAGCLFLNWPSDSQSTPARANLLETFLAIAGTEEMGDKN
jgi:hypothetical protein